MMLGRQMTRDGQAMSGGHLVPHWPGGLFDLPGGGRVYVASTSDPREGGARRPPSAEPGGAPRVRAVRAPAPSPPAAAGGGGAPRRRRDQGADPGLRPVVPEPVLCVHGMAGSTT